MLVAWDTGAAILKDIRHNQLPAGLVASFSCKLNTFRKGVKNVVTGKVIEVGIECK